MSYRNDHDAAIARVDALTHQLDQTEAERDHLQVELEQLRNLSPRATMSTSKLGVSVLAVTLGLCAAVVSQHHASPPAAPAAEPPVAAPLPPPPRPRAAPATLPSANERARDAARLTAVVACVDRVQRATAGAERRTDLRPLRASCLTELASLVSRRADPGAAKELLARWLALEDRLSPSLAAYNTYILRDPEGTHYRAPAELRDAFDAALHARDAILPEVREALGALDHEQSSDPLAHAIVEAPPLTTTR
jgi:hypothetical protein